MSSLHFPDDLIYAVMSRLPTKSMIRFLCVNKTCNSFMHDSYFLQLCKNMNRSNNLFVVVGPPNLPINYSDWGDADDENLNVFLERVPIHEDQGPLELNNSTRILSMPDLIIDLEVQSVNGLLCLHPKLNYLWTMYSSKQASVTTYICNPTTRQVVTLPRDNTVDLYPMYSLLTHFGYCPLRDKYKILRVILNKRIHFQELRILTIGDYVWRNVTHIIPCDLASNINPLKEIGTCVNGAIHWLDDDTYKAITVFDVGSEQFREIPTPIFDEFSGFDSAVVIEFNGYLSLAKYMKNRLIGLSILKDYENQVWIYEWIVPPDGIHSTLRNGYCFPLCRVYTQEIMLLHYHECCGPFKVYYYNTKRRSWRNNLLAEVCIPFLRDLPTVGVQLFRYQENFKRL